MYSRLYLKRNVGKTDQALRIAAGAAMILAPALSGGRSSIKNAIIQGIGGSTMAEGIIGY